jgi:hypothetical protein
MRTEAGCNRQADRAERDLNKKLRVDVVGGEEARVARQVAVDPDSPRAEPKYGIPYDPLPGTDPGRVPPNGPTDPADRVRRP